MNDNLFKIENLSLAFPKENRTVIDHVSFTIPKGKVVGILGESGSGKSLTAYTLMHLLPKHAIIESGDITFYDGEKTIDWLALSKKEKQRIRAKKVAMIFQEPMSSFNPTLKLGKQVVETLTVNEGISNNTAKARVLSLFEEVKLMEPKKVFSSYPHEVSGGQKQRAMIAMALATRPDLLIADEPTTALDVTVQRSILELLKLVQQQYGISILFISHDIGVLAEISDELLVMYHGKMVEKGTTKQITKHPTHPYTRGLMACRPTLNSEQKKLPTVKDFIENNSVCQTPIVSTIDYEKSLLSVNNLNVEYITKRNLLGKTIQAYQAVKAVSFNVFKGETLGLVGESGCGKTTLGRALIHMIKESSDELLYDGMQVSKLKGKKLHTFKKKVQLIFQDPYSSLNPRIYIGEAIAEVMLAHHIGKSRRSRRHKTEALLDKVGLNKNYYYRYPHELSGGQRQRIVIARALATEPEFVICDEAVSSLDVSIQAQILNLLNDLKKQFNLTYIFISHDLAVVKYMSDRIMVMNAGKLVEMNTTEQLYLNPQEEYTKKLLEAIPRI